MCISQVYLIYVDELMAKYLAEAIACIGLHGKYDAFDAEEEESEDEDEESEDEESQDEESQDEESQDGGQ